MRQRFFELKDSILTIRSNAHQSPLAHHRQALLDVCQEHRKWFSVRMDVVQNEANRSRLALHPPRNLHTHHLLRQTQITYQRRCPNWLLTFRDWTLPRSEAPESFVFWTGLFSLASALRRNVVVPKKLLGSWEAYPFLYVFFISSPGRGRKTTTMSYADDLLDEIAPVNSIAQAITQQGLMKKLSELSEPSISIRALEFGTFYKPSGDIMIDFLTALFDGRRRFDSETISRQLEFSAKPCVNLLAATTPGWIADNLSEGLVGGGFMARVVPIFEESVRRRQLYYEELNHKALANLRDNLIADLNHLATSVSGEFKLEEDAKTFSQEWYRKMADRYEKEEDPRLQGYFERKPAYVFKVAMLLHLAYSDELIITLEDYKRALAILQPLERKMLRVFSTVGKNPYTEEMDKIVEFINEKGRVDKREVLGRFYHAVPPDQLSQLLSALVAMEKIGVDAINPSKVVYKRANHHVVDLTSVTASPTIDPATMAAPTASPLTPESESPAGS